MPLSKPTFVLETNPRSVQHARRWVGDACHSLGRDDLVDSAQLGISELVTNALLHGDPPIGVRIRGTVTHPRIEVLDGSVKPPEPNPNMTDDEELLATFGRGLGMVAMCSTAWGAYVLEDGKIVWFEPIAEARSDREAPAGQIYESVSPATGGTPPMPDGGIEVHFDDLPTEVYVDWRRHFRDLRRELVLLSLSHSNAYPVAGTLSDLFVRFEEQVASTQGLDQIEVAIETGAPSVTVTLVVRPDAPSLMAEMLEVLDLADAFCRTERLLSVATTPQQLEFQHWFFGEFVRQGAGGEARAWTGSRSVVSAPHQVR